MRTNNQFYRQKKQTNYRPTFFRKKVFSENKDDVKKLQTAEVNQNIKSNFNANCL